MEFISRITKANNRDQIGSELLANVAGEFDAGFLFVRPGAQTALSEIARVLREKVTIRHLVGCTGAGIIGNGEEIERQTAVALILGKLPAVKCLPFSLNQTQLEGLKSSEDWYHYFEIFPTEKPVFIALPDPFSFDTGRFLEGLNSAYPDCPVIGGLASAASAPGENSLILNEEERSDGVVGVILTGNIRVDTVVSQGCRPIGETFIVTKAEGNIIHRLAGRPFMEILEGILNSLSVNDQALAREAIFLGIAMNEYSQDFKRGDFLIRGLIGIDFKTKSGVIADRIQAGQTVQFHLRDALTAKDDLNALLSFHQAKAIAEKPKGALVFCCNGRGEHLFRTPNHDIGIIQNQIGPIPAAGFFCAGEIGPVGQNNFLHGFTNSIALFYPRE